MNTPINTDYPRLEAFGVVLHRLDAHRIELVRQWRNDPEVNRFLVFRGHITSEMQERWFHNLDHARQRYYVIEVEGQPVGLVNLKDIAFDRRTGEGGIFIADASLRDGWVGMAALLAMYDHGFDDLRLETITAHILADNPRAIRFNEALGFTRCSAELTDGGWRFELIPATYRAKSQRFRQFLTSSTRSTQL